MSVRQPWAWALIFGGKPLENRSWPLPRALLRRRMLIHASSTMTDDEYDDGAAFIRELTGRAPSRSECTLGALIGATTWGACFPPMSGEPRMLEWRRSDQWGWMSVNPRPLVEPVPCKGAKGIWTVPDEVATQLRRLVQPWSAP